MTQEFLQRQSEQQTVTGAPRPDPYRFPPSNLNATPQNLREKTQMPTRPFAPRCTMSVMSAVGTGQRVRILGQEFTRCFLEIQNNANSALKITFGSGGGDYTIQPLATWWVPVCPINELFITQDVGASCTIMTGYDLA